MVQFRLLPVVLGPFTQSCLFTYCIADAHLSGTIKGMWTASGLRTRLLPQFIPAGALRRSPMDPASKCVNQNSAAVARVL